MGKQIKGRRNCKYPKCYYYDSKSKVYCCAACSADHYNYDRLHKEKIKNKKLHPVRFTKKQIAFIKHMIHEKAYEYWEEECGDILSTIEKEDLK